MTNISHSLALDPSTVVHKVTITFAGNEVSAITNCDTVVDTRTWERIASVTHLDNKCEECFKEIT